MNNLVDYLCDKAINFKCIKPEERKLYEFAFGLLITCIYTWGTFLFLGILFGLFPASVCFMIFFIPLRIFCGGLHKDNYSKCYASSVFLFLMILLFSKASTLMLTNALLLALLPLTVWIIFKFSPIESANKPLSNYEKKIYSKISKTILTVEIMIILLLWRSHVDSLVFYFSIIGIDMVGLLMLLKILKNKS